ncbi:MAG: tRNA pseudouridine(13) synthase TruD, partial [Candidatus Omnitrophica bacterium]|nr:tRNA pseudouridine(13) synthase TruD [Candidatus Omnitrophota bacterium]
MNTVIKARPEDFIVKEEAAVTYTARGLYSFYYLEKRGFNTVDAIREISKATKIPSYLFSYGGKKDRHAYTRQLISIEGGRLKDISLENLSLKFCGYSDRPMGPDLIIGNHFEVTVRSLESPILNQMVKRIELAKTQGFVNYFDDQRFGSFDQLQGFLAEKILLGHFNGALKIYLTSIYSGDPKAEKERRSFFHEHWKNWDACHTRAHNAFETFAFNELKKGEKAFITVLNKIPQEELSMYFSAYQSFLWNETAGQLLKQLVNQNLASVKGVVGEYIFYRELSPSILNTVKSMVIPTAAHNTRMSDPVSTKIYTKLLESRGLKSSFF